LIACATEPVATPATPHLRLTPASLGATLALQQQLTATVRGQTHRLDLLLEADPQSVRLAVLSLSQTAARLEWDGTTLSESRASWWPPAVTGERILDDLQLILWPAEAVRSALPEGWSLAAATGLRTVSYQGQVVVRIEYDSAFSAELIHLRDNYRLRVESRPLEAPQ
jgi:hypothetical protein